jgi:hypothetical protein
MQFFQISEVPWELFRLLSTFMVAIMCLHAIRCHIHEFCCNKALHGVTWNYMALHDHFYHRRWLNAPSRWLLSLFLKPDQIFFFLLQDFGSFLIIEAFQIGQDVLLPQSTHICWRSYQTSILRVAI